MIDMTHKHIYMAAVILLLTSVPATAGQGKTAAMTFIDNAMTPRTAAMGGISAGTAPDAGFQLDNIAAIPFFDVTFCGGITYSGWQPSTADAKAGTAGLTYRIGKRLGISAGAYASFNRPYTIVAGDSGTGTERFSPVDWRAGAGVSYLFTGNLSAGISLNYARSSISPYSRDLSTVFAGVQVMYRIKNVSISFTGDNLGLPVTSSSGTRYSLPMNVRLSASYENRWDRHSLAAAVEGQAYFGGLPAGGCSVGAEYGFNSIAALRAGYHYGSNKNGLPSYASIGAGLSLYGITVDAAYLIAPARSAMHNTFMVGIGYRF